MGASNDSAVVDDGNFWRFWVATSSETSEIRQAILYGNMLGIVKFKIDYSVQNDESLRGHCKDVGL